MEITIPYWKKIWQTVASGSCRIPKDVLSRLFNEIGDDLCKGIKVYDTPFNENECQCWLRQSDLKETDYAFEKFFIRLCKSLNVQAQSAWSILCNYLLYEFHGKLSRVKHLATYEPFATKFIEAMWNFYTADRMYLLKTLRFVLENYNNSQYAEVYADYMKRVTWPFLWGNVIGQLNTLVTEINPSTIKNTIDLTAWLERNAHEQLEVALIALAGIDFSNFTVDDFVPLLTIFMRNDFCRIPTLAAATTFNTASYDQLWCVEVGAFLTFLDNCWNNLSFWISKNDELDKIISNATNCKGHDLLMFCWATLQADLCANQGTEYPIRYSKTFDNLLGSGIMMRLQKFSNRIRKFNCKPGRLIMKGIYSLIERLCGLFNEDGIISLRTGVCEVMYELLQDTELCATFLLDVESPIYRLLEFSLKFFPYDFKSMSLLMLALIEKGNNEIVSHTLKNLKIYTEDYSGSLTHDSTIFLRTDYFPVENSQYICIPKGTAVRVYAKFNKTLLLYELDYKYYAVVLSLLDVLTAQINVHRSYKQETFDNLLLSYKLVAAVLQNQLIDVGAMKNFLRKLSHIYQLFSQGEFQNLAIMSVFLQSVEGAMFSKIKEEDKFWPSDFLPLLNRMEIDKNFMHSGQFLRSVLLDLIEREEQTDSHELLLTYIQFIRTTTKKRAFYKEIQLPGIVYLVTHIFPKHKDFKYEKQLDCYNITNRILELVWDIIKKDHRTIDNEDERFLFNFCLESFLSDSFVLKGYVELFKVTSFIAQKFLEKEISWEGKQNVIINKCVTLTLQIFLMLIKYNRYRKKKQISTTSLFEEVILHAPLDRLNIVKIITAFVDYAFDIEVQKLALRVLQNMALDDFYPMFGPMDLEPFQLQSFFLDKLRDPIQSDEIKMAIIDFVYTCVEHQAGLTNAFFNINHKTEKDDEEGESVVSCMLDFLENIEESKISIQHPLLRGMLSVIHKVWDVGSVHLIEKVTEIEKFWPTLLKPLYYELEGDSKFYGYIFGILAHEFLYSRDKYSEEFKDAIRELLDVKSGFMKNWSVYLVKISNTIKHSKSTDQFEDVTYTGDIFVLYTWKLFVTYGQMFAADFFLNPELRTIIADTCLDALLAHFSTMVELPCIKFWSELYALTLNAWPAESFMAVPEFFVKTGKVLGALAVDYKTMNSSAKQAILTATAILIKKFNKYANEHPEAVQDILDPLGSIIRYEFHELADDMEVAYTREINNMPESLSNWLLTLSVVNKVLLLKSVGKHAHWFESTGFIKKVVWCIGPFIQSPKTLPFAKFAMKSLITYGQSPFVNNLLSMNKGTFFKETVPPTEYVYPPLKNLQLMREWWITYSELIKFMNFLIMKFCYAFTADVLTFINFHDDTIIACLELPRITADPAALNLVCCVMMFCNSMLPWRGRWMVNKDSYFQRTVHSIKSCISGVCNLLLTPKHLAFVSVYDLTNYVSNQLISDDTYLDIYNMVLEIITLGFRFFAKCHPSLLTYIDHPEERYVILEIEKDFFIPKYTNMELNIFTYGGIFAILHILCKAYMKLRENLRKKAAGPVEKMLIRRTIKPVPSIEAIITREETIDTPVKRIEPFLAVVLAQGEADLVHDSTGSVQRFGSTNFNLFEMPWFLDLNYKTVQMSLEVLSHFVSLEICSDLNSTNISPEIKEHLKREMNSEMQFFNDFVRRTIQERIETMRVRHTSPRKLRQLEKMSSYMNRLLREKNVEFHDEFLWVLDHIVQDFCKTEDDN